MKRFTSFAFAIVFLAGLAVSAPARAAGELSGSTIGMIGIDVYGTVFFALTSVPIPTWGCTNAGQLRFDGRTDAGKAMYSTLLAAKLSGKIVVAYSSGSCYTSYPSIGYTYVP